MVSGQVQTVSGSAHLDPPLPARLVVYIRSMSWLGCTAELALPRGCRLALGLAGGTEQRQTVRPATADRVM